MELALTGGHAWQILSPQLQIHRYYNSNNEEERMLTINVVKTQIMIRFTYT